MSITRKRQIFKAMKFRNIKHAKFYSSEIKWVYSIRDRATSHGRGYCVVRATLLI